MEHSKIESSISQYVETWNLEDIEAIKKAIPAFWTPETTYEDVNTPKATGIDALAGLMMESYKILPGRKFRQLTIPNIVAQSGRYTWLLIRADGTTAEGMDFFEFDVNGLITRIVGFVVPLESFGG